MKIKITGDTTNDLPSELIKKYNITLKPIIVNLGEQEYRDGENIKLEEVFDFVDKTGQLPKTAALNPLEFEEFFKQQLESDGGYDAIIYFSLSSEISSLYQNALVASKKFNNVYVIDSKTLSTAIGLQILYACELREQGLSAKEIVEKVEARKQYAQASFVLDTLKYLHKGGRCSGLAVFGANLLKIHPSIILKDGKMGVGKKFRGKYKDVVLEYVDSILETYPNFDKKRCFITYTTIEDDIVDAIKEKIKDKFDEIIVSTASCTIGSHCGRNTIGILYYTDGGVNE